MMQALERLSRLLSRVSLILAGAALVAMTIILGWQVVARYALNSSLAWSEQVALVLMVGMTSLAAAAGVREGFHLGMTMAVNALPPNPRRVARALSAIVVGGFGAALGVHGAELVSATWSHVLPTLGIPRGAAYLPLAAGGWLIVFFAAEQVVAEARGRKVEPLWS